jgi:hypothetical protein
MAAIPTFLPNPLNTWRTRGDHVCENSRPAFGRCFFGMPTDC